MPAIDSLRGAAAFKNGFGLKTGCANGMGLEKANGKKGNILQSLYFSPNSAQRFCVLLVYRVVPVLETEYFKRQVFEALLFHRKNFIFMFTNHRR